MLKLFRKKGLTKKILWVIAVLIILSFALGYSVSRYSNPTRTNVVAGKVFGQTIRLKEFQSYLLAARDQTLLTYGVEAEKFLPYIDMNNEAWTRILLIKEAERRGVKALDREVISYIGHIPAFQRDGEFDKQLYKSILAHVFRRDAREFEEAIRDQIKIGKLLQTSVGRVSVSEQTIREEYIKRNRKLQAGYVLIDPKPLAKDISASDADLQTYYDAHRDTFKTSDTINAQYVKLAINEKMPSAEHQKLNQTAQAVYQKATASGDLAAAAKELNLELKETGLFSMDTPNLETGWSLELLSQSFDAKPGTVLAPSVSPTGITVAKIIDHQPASVQPFDKVKEQVRERLLLDKATVIAKQKAIDIRAALAKTPSAEGKTDFAAATRNLGYTPKETPFFAVGDYIPEIGLSEDFNTAAETASEKNPLSDVVITAKGPVILWYEAVQPIDEKKFEEVKKDFALTLYREESSKAVNSVVKEIRARAKLESYLDKKTVNKNKS